MPFIRVIFLLLLLFNVRTVFSQSLSNLRQKLIETKSDQIKLDSLSIEPMSFSIKGIPDSDYIIDYATAVLKWIRKPTINQVEIRYRVLSIYLPTDTKRMSFDSVLNRFSIGQAQLTTSPSNQKPFDFGKINSNGSLGRSLSFGNKQDAVFNSSLNLQLNGYIGDSILIAAAISDNNIPIQPDGNTQNLNEFDQVYIQFTRNKWKLNLGDFDLRQNDMYFMNFYKRLQGVSFMSEDSLSSQLKNKINLNAAIAKGKFTRNVFQGIEGNQGPYRLKGANQELFFIVLAGTERIYIDGVLMQRGEDQDYVINYNTAEITFTPNRMITKDKRIQVEFEYADRNYLNSQLYFKNEIQLSNKLNIKVGFFNNGDAKNSPISQVLSPNQRQFLSSVGDNISKAYYNSAVADTFEIGKILYRAVDTLDALNRKDTVYVYERNRMDGLYSLSFIDLGEGQADYILDQTSGSNGQVYKWISPDPITGKKRGRFDPSVLLVTPKNQQLLSIATEWNVNQRSSLLTDIAFSNYNLNRFSAKDRQNDDGLGAKLYFKNNTIVSSAKAISLISTLKGEYASATFRPIERLRSVEFGRDWGLELVNKPADEKIMGADFKLTNDQGHSLKLESSAYQRDNNFNANKTLLEHQYSKKSWNIYNKYGYTSFQDGDKSGYFIRPVIDMSKQFSKFNNRTIGVLYTLEKSISREISSNLLTPYSFSFSTFQVKTESDPLRENKWGVAYFTRKDELPNQKSMIKTDQSHNYVINTELMSNSHHQLKMSSTYRTLKVYNSISNQKSENSLLGRIQYFSDIWKGAINGDVLYELGNAQEPRRNFSFIQVPAGQGEYTWIDFNNDGIQQLNEFETAKFRDQANYFRIATPTSEYIKADYLQLNYNVNIDPSVALSSLKKSAVYDFFRRFYLSSSLQVNQKQTASDNRNLNPFSDVIIDTSLIAYDMIFSNSFSFNKTSQVWGIDFNRFQAANRTYLSFGYESRENISNLLRLRSNWFRVITLDLLGRKSITNLSTPNFANRNYDINALSIEPKLTYTMQTKFRLSVGYKIEEKSNSGSEKADINIFNLDAKYNLLSNLSVSSSFNYGKIKYSGISNTNLSYVMLDGLMPGKNILWTLEITKRLSSFLEMSVQYEGRKAGESGLVNLGRAQVRAIL